VTGPRQAAARSIAVVPGDGTVVPAPGGTADTDAVVDLVHS